MRITKKRLLENFKVNLIVIGKKDYIFNIFGGRKTKRIMKVNVKGASAEIAIWMLQFNYFIGMSTYKKLAVGDMLEKLCLIMAIAAIVIHYIGDKNTLIKKSGFLLMCLLPTIAVYTAVTTSGGTMIKMFLFALAFKDVEKKDIWKYYYKSTAAAVIFVVVSACMGLIEKTQIQKNGTYAYGLGFNANILDISVFLVLIVRLYLMEQRPKIWWEGIIAEIIINSITICRAVVAFLILLAIVMLFDITRNMSVKFLTCISGSLPILLSCFSIFIAQNFDISDAGWLTVNRIMSARPYLYHLYYTNFPIKMFGNYFDKTSYGAMDNTYLMLLLRYGIVIYAIYMIIFFKTIIIAKRNRDWLCLYITIVYFAYFCVEYSPSIMNLDFVLIYFWLEFWEKNTG